MQEHTKKPDTDEISMTFIGPIAMMGQALEVMRSLGFEEVKQPSLKLTVKGYREGLTQVELAERSGIPRRHISEMENGKRPIGKMNACKLAEVLNIDPRRLLSM